MQDEESQRSARQPADIHSLPTEVLLGIFSFLELKPYITAHAVCKYWRHLLPLAEIHPIRRRLFNLYHHIINTPQFTRTRGWTLENLQPFDRQAYIDCLLSQYPAIPEEFRLWILEWPARLAIRCSWPGLPFKQILTPNYDKRDGVNWLAWMGHESRSCPELLALLYKRSRTDDFKFIPGLMIWRDWNTTTWLVFEQEEDLLFGRVYVIDILELSGHPGVIPYDFNDDPDPHGDDSTSEDSFALEPQINIPFPDWISYMEHSWDSAAKYLLGPDAPRHISLPDHSIPDPVEFNFNSSIASCHPSPFWASRHTATGYLSMTV